jgi:hypothetical protein
VPQESRAIAVIMAAAFLCGLILVLLFENTATLKRGDNFPPPSPRAALHMDTALVCWRKLAGLHLSPFVSPAGDNSRIQQVVEVNLGFVWENVFELHGRLLTMTVFHIFRDISEKKPDYSGWFLSGFL